MLVGPKLSGVSGEELFVGGAGVGAIAGCILFLFDSDGDAENRDRKATPNERLAAGFALGGSILPIVGILLGVVAIAITRKSRSWARPASWIAAIGSVAWTLAVLRWVGLLVEKSAV